MAENKIVTKPKEPEKVKPGKPPKVKTMNVNSGKDQKIIGASAPAKKGGK